jgi:hypothetical protein
MKLLDTSPIAPGISFVPKGGTLEFLQLSHKDTLSGFIKSYIGAAYSDSTPFILIGCVNTGSGDNYVISAGTIFFRGEMFLVQASSFAISGGAEAIAQLTIITYTDDADPSIFTDGETRNVHNDRQIAFVSGNSSTSFYLFNFSDVVYLQYRPVGAIGQTIIWNMPAGGVLTTYFNMAAGDSYGTGIHPLTLGWQIDITMAGYVAAGYLNSDPTFGTLGQEQGELSHILGTYEIPKLQTTSSFQSGSTTGSITSFGAVSDAFSQKQVDVNEYPQLGADGVTELTSNSPVSLLQPTVTKLYILRIS